MLVPGPLLALSGPVYHYNLSKSLDLNSPEKWVGSEILPIILVVRSSSK